MKDEGWTTMRFDEFAERVNETVMPAESDLDRYIGLEHIDSMDLTIRRWDEGRNLVGQKLVVRKGDIIIARRNWYLRRVAIAPFDALCSAHAMIVRPKTDAINRDFFPFFLLSNQFYQKAMKISVGSLSPTINWNTLKQVSFDLPPPEKMKDYATILKQLLTTYNLMNVLCQKITHLSSSWIKKLDCDEQWCRLGDVAEIRNGATPSRKNRDYWGGNIPWVGSGVVNNRHVSEPAEYVSQDGANAANLRIVPRDSILIGMVGQGKTRGKSALLKIDTAINQNLAAVIPHDPKISYVLFRWLERIYPILRGIAQGSSQPALNCGIIRSVKIPISVINATESDAAMLKKLDELFDKCEQTSSTSLDLSHSIIKKITVKA